MTIPSSATAITTPEPQPDTSATSVPAPSTSYTSQTPTSSSATTATSSSSDNVVEMSPQQYIIMLQQENNRHLEHIKDELSTLNSHLGLIAQIMLKRSEQ